MGLSHGVLKVSSRATPQCPREVLSRDDRTDGYCRCPECPNPGHCPPELPNYESRAPPRASVRQGKETDHLVGTREVLRDDRTVDCRQEREVGQATVVVRTLTSQSDDNGRLREVIIKCLMDRCQ